MIKHVGFQNKEPWDHPKKAASFVSSWQKLHQKYIKTSQLLLPTTPNKLSDNIEQRWWLTQWWTGQGLTDEWNVLKTMAKQKVLVIKQTI